jgi:hypothetical protein
MRLAEARIPVPDTVTYVPGDLEHGSPAGGGLVANGFAPSRPALVSRLGPAAPGRTRWVVTPVRTREAPPVFGRYGNGR